MSQRARTVGTFTFAVVAGSLVIGSVPGARADDRASPATLVAVARPSDDISRVFRFHAGAQAEALREALDRASLDVALKEGLRKLVDQHLRLAEEEAGRASKAYSAPPAGAAPTARRRTVDDVVAQALKLAHEFNDEQVAAWLDEHPAAYQPVQEQIALAEAFQRAAAEEPDAIVRAATAAGAAADRFPDLRKALTSVRERLTKGADADVKRLREAEEKARPPGKGPPSTVKGEGGAAAPPDPLLPPPPSPESEALDLLEQLTDLGAHERLTAAGRDARAEAEKLLSTPAQRKALEDEMLRWYQAHVPPEDAPPEGKGPAHKEGSPADPGF